MKKPWLEYLVCLIAVGLFIWSRQWGAAFWPIICAGLTWQLEHQRHQYRVLQARHKETFDRLISELSKR